MTSRPRISDDQRRARIAQRHGLHPQHRLPDVLSATRAMTVLHATEAASVHLSLAARVQDVRVADVDQALYADRTLVKQLAMRRTLFAFPRDLLPAAWGSSSARVAKAEAARAAKAVVAAGHATDGAAWFNEARERVRSRLADVPKGLSTNDIRESVPFVDVRASSSPSSARWGQPQQVAPWVLTHLGLTGDIVRGAPDGHWRNPRARWTTTRDWLGDDASPLDAAAGYAELIRRYLTTFGPATEDDVVWWLGSTKTAVRQALSTLEIVAVELDGGATGYLLPDDLDLVAEDMGEWAALVPTLDPTLMGWKERDFYLDPADRPFLFDTNGNGGTTAWWCGRVVGCWVQDPDGQVRVVPRGTLATPARRALETEAERLTEFLEGDVVSSVYASQMQRSALLP